MSFSLEPLDEIMWLLIEILYQWLWGCFQWHILQSLCHPVVEFSFSWALTNHVGSLAIEKISILTSFVYCYLHTLLVGLFVHPEVRGPIFGHLQNPRSERALPLRRHTLDMRLCILLCPPTPQPKLGYRWCNWAWQGALRFGVGEVVGEVSQVVVGGLAKEVIVGVLQPTLAQIFCSKLVSNSLGSASRRPHLQYWAMCDDHDTSHIVRC